MNDMTNVEPGARDVTWRNVAVVAPLVRYMLTPVETTSAGSRASKPASARALLPSVSRSDERKPNLVSQDVRRRVRLDVERAPQGDAHGRIFGCDRVLTLHVVATIGRKLARRKRGREFDFLGN